MNAYPLPLEEITTDELRTHRSEISAFISAINFNVLEFVLYKNNVPSTVPKSRFSFDARIAVIFNLSGREIRTDPELFHRNNPLSLPIHNVF
jgi:hypothetical protein